MNAQIEVSIEAEEKLKKLAKSRIRGALKSTPGYPFYKRGAYRAVAESRLCPLGSTAGAIVTKAVNEMLEEGEIVGKDTIVVYPKNHPLTEVNFGGMKLAE